MSINAFQEWLYRRENDGFDGNRKHVRWFETLPGLRLIAMQVYQDMTHPLTSYYCNSSHNTYLGENQLTGRSSLQMYSSVLQKGCRCIECM